jgi:hypothetical protein
MAFATQDLFLTGYTRQVFQIYGPNGAVAGEWRAQCAGNALGSSWFPVRDLDEGAGVFVVAFAANPPGWSPFGDEVDVTFLNSDIIQGIPPATAPLAVTVARGIIFAWVTLPSFPGATYALVFVKGVDGAADNLIGALPEELGIVRRNPRFFPKGP